LRLGALTVSLGAGRMLRPWLRVLGVSGAERDSTDGDAGINGLRRRIAGGSFGGGFPVMIRT
jgi:hypothetical protein